MISKENSQHQIDDGQQGEINILDSNARMLGSPCECEPKSIHVSECVSIRVR